MLKLTLNRMLQINREACKHCCVLGTKHYPGTRHNYKIKDIKTAEIHKPEGSAPLTPHLPLQRNILLPYFTFPVTLLVLSSNSLSHVRSFYAVFSPISCMRWSASPSRGSSLQGLDYGQSHQRIYLSRLTRSKMPTTAVSPLSAFNLKSEECPLSETLWGFFGLTRWTMSKMSVMVCGLIYSQDSTKSTTLIEGAEVLLLFTVKSKRVWNGIITRISRICFTAFNRKLIHKQKNYAKSLHFSTINCICKEK
jgi:hypothetical protein